MSASCYSQVSLLGNPASGRGRGGAALARVERVLRERGVEVSTLRTERAGHAVELARVAATGGTQLLLVLGGDGTVRDAVEGLLATGKPEAELPPLGILPGGTGNDLARSLGVPLSRERAVEVALTGQPRLLDAWTWNGTPFVNVAGVGLDACVAGVVNRRFRHLNGALAYVSAALSVLPRFQPFELRVRLPGREWAGKVWLAAFANARCYGGGLPIAPDADPADGLLDVVLVEDMPRLELLTQLPALAAGKHVRHPRVHVLRGDEVTLEAPPQEATLDGELLEETPAVVKRAGVRIRVMVAETRSGAALNCEHG